MYIYIETYVFTYINIYIYMNIIGMGREMYISLYTCIFTYVDVFTEPEPKLQIRPNAKRLGAALC